MFQFNIGPFFVWVIKHGPELFFNCFMGLIFAVAVVRQKRTSKIITNVLNGWYFFSFHKTIHHFRCSG